MKPPPFRYERASTVDEALELLDSDDDVKPLAGGQSLASLMNLRMARPDVLVDIAPLSDLSYIKVSGDGIDVGALTTQAELLADAAAMGASPMLADALPHVGHTAIRNRGTIGGSIAHADPSAELPVVLAALGGNVTVRSRGSERQVEAGDLFTGFLQTSLEPGELITSVHFPKVADGARSSFVEFARRHGDFALVSVACVVHGQEEVSEARIALGGLGTAPVVLEARDEIAGATLDAAATKMAETADAAVEPTGDIHGSAEYRRHLVRELVKRAMLNAGNGK